MCKYLVYSAHEFKRSKISINTNKSSEQIVSKSLNSNILYDLKISSKLFYPFSGIVWIKLRYLR